MTDDSFAELLNLGWEMKQGLASAILNPHLRLFLDLLRESGAEALKISGAGGGGFVLAKLPSRDTAALEESFGASNLVRPELCFEGSRRLKDL